MADKPAEDHTTDMDAAEDLGILTSRSHKAMIDADNERVRDMSVAAAKAQVDAAKANLATAKDAAKDETPPPKSPADTPKSDT